MSKRNKYYIHDRDKSQSSDLRTSERYAIVNRETNRIVAEAPNQYEARQEADLWNSGIYKEDDQ